PPPRPGTGGRAAGADSVRRQGGEAVAALGGTDQQEERLPGSRLLDLGPQSADAADRAPVDLQDDVSRLHLGLGGRAVGGDPRHQDALTGVEVALPALLRGQVTQRETPFAAVRGAVVGRRLVVGELGDGDLQVADLAVAADLDGDGLADGGAGDEHRERPGLVDGLAVPATDDVPGLEPRLRRGPVGGHAGDTRPVRAVSRHRLRQLGGQLLDRDAEPAAGHVALLLHLGHELLRQVDRDGEADADVAAALAEDRRVDADDVAVLVEQGSTRVARIDRRVGLDEVVVRALPDGTALRADDPRGDRLV